MIILHVQFINCRWAQGFTTKNIAFVDNKTVCYTSGNHVCFLNLETKVQSVLQGPSRGIGALTASGKDGIFAFSEERLSPSIFLYSFPELQMKSELKGKTGVYHSRLYHRLYCTCNVHQSWINVVSKGETEEVWLNRLVCIHNPSVTSLRLN